MSNQTNRFIYKFNNGVHKAFDTLKYDDTDTFVLYKDAIQRIEWLNRPSKK